MPEVRLLPPEVDVNDARSLVGGALRLARHLFGRHQRRIVGGIGEARGQPAGDDGLLHSVSRRDSMVTVEAAFGGKPLLIATRRCAAIGTRSDRFRTVVYLEE